MRCKINLPGLAPYAGSAVTMDYGHMLVDSSVPHRAGALFLNDAARVKGGGFR
jgi:hypothetical protein